MHLSTTIEKKNLKGLCSRQLGYRLVVFYEIVSKMHE